MALAMACLSARRVAAAYVGYRSRTSCWSWTLPAFAAAPVLLPKRTSHGATGAFTKVPPARAGEEQTLVLLFFVRRHTEEEEEDDDVDDAAEEDDCDEDMVLVCLCVCVFVCVCV